VKILGPCNLPADVPVHASEMFSRNIVNFLQLLVRDGQLHIDLEDEIVRDTLLCRGREVVHEKIRELLGLPAPVAAGAESDATAADS
jgi:NAD(P) transhydrogenase subunit alpha